jgi:hypothetical protein
MHTAVHVLLAFEVAGDLVANNPLRQFVDSVGIDCHVYGVAKPHPAAVAYGPSVSKTGMDNDKNPLPGYTYMSKSLEAFGAPGRKVRIATKAVDSTEQYAFAEVKGEVGRLVALTIGLLLLPIMARAQQPAGAAPQTEDLAKELSNPVSSLVSVPFEFNWEQTVGPTDGTRFILNVQPVMPFSMNQDWNLIVRLITPLVSQPPLSDGGVAASGISDITTSFFLSPARSGLIWGAGPVIVLPSTSEPTLGTGKWSAGPTVVVLTQTGNWTAGALWNQVWSFAGDTAAPTSTKCFCSRSSPIRPRRRLR